MPSIGGYHPYGLASILTGLESNRACVGYAGRRIAAREPPPTCLPELLRALLDEWCNIPHDQIDNLILSMLRCFKSCLEGTHVTSVDRLRQKRKSPKGSNPVTSNGSTECTKKYKNNKEFMDDYLDSIISNRISYEEQARADRKSKEEQARADRKSKEEQARVTAESQLEFERINLEKVKLEIELGK
ncbi:uncharacterized protein TNCV_2006031 [Trichonephila clavipes]|nr:uncharacterized protein TNCV_2006031 [Trichonephila clavipes]